MSVAYALPPRVAAVRLSTAAAALAGSGDTGDDGPRLARMAATGPDAWTPDMVESAAATMQRHRGLLVAAGIDPDLLPQPGAPAPQAPEPVRQAPPPPAQPGPPTVDVVAVFDAAEDTPAEPETAPAPEPFVYDHSIDGLRGIPITDLSSVGPKAGEAFEAAGLSTVYDLLMHVPLRYIDRTARTPIAALAAGETGTTIARVESAKTDTTRTGQRIARIVVVDDSGVLTATFFNAPWQAKRFAKGDEVVVQGRLDVWVPDNGGAPRLSMVNPLMDRTGDQFAPIIPVYPQCGESTAAGKWKATLTTWQVHRAAMEAVARMGDLADPVPAEVVAARGLIPRGDAYRLVHHPRIAGDEETARERLAYDELLRMQTALRMRRAITATTTGVAHTVTGALTGRFITGLPYPLTGAQSRAFAALTERMTAPAPMNVLLQGDVGAGKSTVAALALLSAVESGKQAALMAPTEILATQLHTEIATLVDGMTDATGAPLTVGLMTNKVRSRARRDTIAALTAGDMPLIVGTHALLSDDVEFADLGLVVIDEQHRFGVAQRAALRDKGRGVVPDVMVMTATPIPRTAAMTVFGDLDVIVLDELPPGRTPIRTEWVDATPDLTDATDPTWTLVREQIAEGRQAYVVCPLVTESETKSAANATDTATGLSAGALAGLRVGVAHGKQHPDERASVMAAFKAGDLDVLVATTVIEVGVNVPNAAVIVILDPGNFGIAQLHQLRGRVGRGKHASTCVLAGEVSTPDGIQRMEALCASTNGFVLSEKDLQIRGHGQVLGSTQAGMSDLRVASLDRDRDLLAAAKVDADTLVGNDPELARRPGLRAEIDNALGPDAADWLTRG